MPHPKQAPWLCSVTDPGHIFTALAGKGRWVLNGSWTSLLSVSPHTHTPRWYTPKGQVPFCLICYLSPVHSTVAAKGPWEVSVEEGWEAAPQHQWWQSLGQSHPPSLGTGFSAPGPDTFLVPQTYFGIFVSEAVRVKGGSYSPAPTVVSPHVLASLRGALPPPLPREGNTGSRANGPGVHSLLPKLPGAFHFLSRVIRGKRQLSLLASLAGLKPGDICSHRRKRRVALGRILNPDCSSSP